jgi:PKHD-type hydroxylase
MNLYNFKDFGSLPNSFFWQTGVFSDSELDQLQHIASSSTDSAYTLNSKGMDDTSINVRRTRVTWLYLNPDTTWIFDKINKTVSHFNTTFFGFDLRSIESLQMGNYTSQEQGTYDWHRDDNPSIHCRKLSISILLTPPEDYEGGDLLINNDREEICTVPRKRGIISVFPSYMHHKVTPVTKGSRQSLVTWILGPKFK